MPQELDFRSSIATLWFRLIALGIVALVFYEALVLAQGQAQGWSYYLTMWEVAFEVAVRVIAAALAGVAAGTLVCGVMAPFVWHVASSRQRLIDATAKVAVVLVVFLLSQYALQVLINWSYHWFNHGALFDKALIAAYYVAFVLALCIPRARKEVVTSFDGLLSKKMTRRTALATAVGTAAVVSTEYLLNKQLPSIRAAFPPQRPRTNLLLITFDALSAEDMSLYGYKLPTTPNIDAFASKATVFTNFYSASTFTTPCIAALLTGVYPSETLVYQLQGRVRAQGIASLPRALKAAGYSTGAFLSNSFAYYFAKSLEDDFDSLPEPIFTAGGLQRLWDATTALHQDSGVGSRVDEYRDLSRVWNYLHRMPNNLQERYPAAASFAHAQQVIAGLPEGFFLWVHVMTPHYPYLPGAADRGRFLHDNGSQALDRDNDRLWYPTYPPDKQNLVDQHRLRYDEFIATGDRAFGAFMAQLEKSGKLQNTTVIVSADHGESFEGGVYRHESPYQTRPVIHVPLIIRMAGQQEKRTVAVTADQTTLAPTILDLAGQTKPSNMRSASLVEWLDRDGRGENQGIAFSEYFARNSVFEPLRCGSVSAIDGQYQYVLYLESGTGVLRPLNEAQIWDVDRSAENPQRAEILRAAIHARFPEIWRSSGQPL